MAKYAQFDFLDYLIVINKWKLFIITVFVFTFLASYLAIYFFVPEKFDSSAVIIPSEQNSMNNIAGLMKSFSGLPALSGLKSNDETDLFATIIYSRTNLSKVIDKFGLYKEYKLDSYEKTLKELRSNIITQESDQGAFEIKVRGSSPQKSSEMANYIIELLNQTIVDLNIRKSHENRVFLESRYDEIKNNLRKSEDSLKYFQVNTGLISATDQGKASFDFYSKLESDLALKKVELSVYNKLYGENSPVTQNSKLLADEYQKTLNNFKVNSDNTNLILSINKLPSNLLTYYRLSRDIKIYNSILEFLVPLYEQARFDEVKDIPILQVIDKAVPPEKRAYPQRVLASLIISFIIAFLLLFGIIIKELLQNSSNEKIIYLKKEFFKFRKHPVL